MPCASVRAVNFSYFPRSILTLSHHLLLKIRYCIPPQRCKVSKCRDEDCDDFLPWLENKAGVRISSLLAIGNSDYGRSLFACKSIQAGDSLLKVPFVLQISPDNVLPDIKPFLTDSVGAVAKLALVILVEQKKGQKSEWAPYISRLPQHGELHSTIFWSENELKMIQQSSLYQETIDQKAQIKKEFLAIKPVFDRFPDIFEGVNFENFKHAYGLVASRAWESMKGQSLIPFADFLNHNGTSQSVLVSDEYRQLSEVIADRDYVPGEEVFIRYGRFPNSVLVLDFGFTVPNNMYDQVCIQVDIPYDDHLRAMKLDLLQKNCLPKLKDAYFSSSGGSFIMKEVRSARGKGKGIPQSLRAFARVLCSSSPQELNDLALEAVQQDGRLARRPLINRSLEIQAHEILLSQIDKLIANNNMSIENLQAVDAEFTNCRRFSIRRQMAQDLLTGEVRVLRSASAWLTNYCQLVRSNRKQL
ncbi:ribulose-1,5 bisphosphate carboxylase/oxygenase large subunit N-methyltransferase, chloroplastic isoform X1 [Amaranthus tricolor]|uniref:ribulose-1,5 bisphosphate carboxylase/oxygenase large subunit N-methyltransferase, chloroplastic isoform X1 n=1 Tax=Amaranthus tricolor TaxID=29722 RepID=UPI002585BBBF|nr:ribulose-1,5 bisphosphate carboxylase/oxygenase large subunit N-methyltransferase, chloroplastic isoform X1 [Amaranthus tricolor]